MQAFGHQPLESRPLQRCQGYLPDVAILGAQSLQHPGQRLRAVYFVVPVRSDHQQVAHVRLGEQMFEQPQCRFIRPLQVIYEQHEGVLGCREHAQESAYRSTEAVRDILRRHFRGGWLATDDHFELGSERRGRSTERHHGHEGHEARPPPVNSGRGPCARPSSGSAAPNAD